MLPIGTLVDDPHGVPPGTPLMKRICCRCELVLGWVVCQADRAGRVTHPYCAPCAAAFEEELAAWYPPEEAARRAAAITQDAIRVPTLSAPGACPDRQVFSYGAGDTEQADGGRSL